ncbi:MAG: hypothetical protein B7Z31_14480 [Rhodobacterales bacterium 12-65-15]|nr:MAG: hypothetical protein B7Z31_14480 [Rhodobacterales bacterium 12-65-15]
MFETLVISDVLRNLIYLVVAYALAFPIGWHRELEERSAGLRTFPLVSMASCGFVMIATQVLEPESHAQVLEGLITGIGFIGGGAILKQGDRAVGTATAAGLWATGATGAAVGFGQLDIAVILSVVIFMTLTLLAPLKRAINDEPEEPEPNVEGED